MANESSQPEQEDRIADLERQLAELKARFEATVNAERLFRQLFENAPIGAFRADAEGELLAVNNAFAALFGYESPAEVISTIKNVAEQMYVQPERRAVIIREAVRHDRLLDFENQYRRKDGSEFTGLLQLRVVRSGDGSISHMEGFVQDISARKAAEEALRENEVKYRQLFEMESDAILLVERETGRILEANTSAEKMYGYTREELLSMTNVDISDEPEKTIEATRDIPPLIPLRFHRRKDGTVFPVEIASTKFKWRGEEVLVAGIRDISERFYHQREIEEQRSFFRKVIGSSPNIFFVKDRDNRIVLANEAFAERHGCEFDGIIGLTTREVVVGDEDLAEELYREDMDIINGVREKSVKERSYLDRSGRTRWTHTVKMPIKDEQGRILFVVGAGTDITERKETEEALRTSEEIYRALFMAANDGIFLMDGDRFLDCNPRALEIFGRSREEIIGKTPGDFSPEYQPDGQPSKEKSGQLIDVARDGASRMIEWRHLRKDGSIFDAEVGLTRLQLAKKPFVLALVRDVTERKRAEEALRESERQLANLFRNLQGMAYRCLNDEDWTMEFVSQGCLELTGYQSADLLFNRKLSYKDIVYPEDRDYVRREIQRTLALGEPYRLQYRIVAADGEVKWVWEQGRRIQTDGRDLLEGFIADMTDRVKAEEALKESERQMATLLSNLQGMAYRCANDKEWTMEFASQGCLALTGYDPADLIRNSKIAYEEIIHPQDRAHVWHVVQEALERDLPFQINYRIVTAAGEEKWVWEQGRRVVTHGKEFLEGFITDMTDRTRAEEALRESEHRFRTAFLTSPDSVNINRLSDGVYVTVNEGFTAITGYSAEEALGQSARSLNIWADIGDQERLVALLRQDGQVRNMEAKFLLKDGRVKTCLMSAALINLQDEPHIISISRDISELIEARNAVEQSEKRYRLLLEKAPLGVLTMNADGSIAELNAKFLEIVDAPSEEAVRDMNLLADPGLVEAGIACRFQQCLEEGVTGIFESSYTSAWGKSAYLRYHLQPIRSAGGDINGVQAIVEDISEARKLEEQLAQAQKMEAIGTLAGGIAHDFNNLLMGIQGNTSLLLLDAEPGHPYHESLKAIEQAVQNGAALTRQLLGFARGGKYEVKVSDPNELIKKSSAMFGRTRKEIRIHRKYLKDVWTVEVDRSQMEQVLLNLFVNAWQAMPGGGDLFLETANVVPDEEYLRANNVSPGRYVRLSVTDTGTGMDTATRSRIFEPFFTTKEMGRGTGLGLASAYGIIKNHGGFITVYSEEGEGTTFNIYLPASDKALENLPPLLQDLQTGSETILLVDDEPLILEVGRQMLERLGYRVLTAESGLGGVEVFRENKDLINLVVMDMIMPDLGGGEACEQIKAINPQVRIILSSGYSLNGKASEILKRSCEGFLQKPFSLTDLSGKIRDILSGQL